MPTNTSLMCNNHSLTTFNTITQAVIVKYIKSGPTNATLAPFIYTQFGAFRPTFHIKTVPKRVGRKGSAENRTGPNSDQTLLIYLAIIFSWIFSSSHVLETVTWWQHFNVAFTWYFLLINLNCDLFYVKLIDLTTQCKCEFLLQCWIIDQLT